MTDLTNQLPPQWISTEISNVTKIVSGGTPASKDLTNFTKVGGIPWITPADLSGYRGQYIASGARNLSHKGLKTSSANLLPKNTVLFSSRAPIGYVAISENEIATNQGFKSFIPSKAINTKFLYFYLRHATPIAEAMATGTTFKELSGSKAARLPILVPPLNEQKRIADKLDALLAAVDACRARLDKIPTLIKRFRQSVLAAATSGALTQEWRLQESRAGYPEKCSDIFQWKNSKLGEIVKVIDPNPSHRYPSYENGSIPLLSTEQMEGLESWDTSKAKLTTSDFWQTRNALHGFKPNDIVFARKGRLGLARKPPNISKYAFSHTVFLLRAIENNVLPDYLLWYMRRDSVVEWLLAEMNSNTGVPTLGKSVMERLPLTIPPLAEQTEIVRRVGALFSTADKLEASLATARKRVDQLTPAILAQAFRGELVAQDPTDEPASVLLARIADTAVPKRALKKAA